MDRLLPSVIVVAIIVLAFAGMFIGWRARSRSQTAIPRPEPVPNELGPTTATASGLYVATTLADQPLERITVNGLGFRSKMALTVSSSGLVLELTGQQPAFIASANIRGVDRSAWAIDKGVESDGLMRIGWRLGDTDVDSYLRLDSSTEEAIDAALALVGAGK